MPPFLVSEDLLFFFQTLVNWTTALRQSIMNFLIRKDITHIEKCKGKQNKHYVPTTQLWLMITLVLFAVKASCVHILNPVASSSPRTSSILIWVQRPILISIIMGLDHLCCHVGEIISLVYQRLFCSQYLKAPPKAYTRETNKT